MIDLHIHSTASDGTFSPCDLVGLARGAGLSAMALTDHDTVAGIPEFQSAAAAAGIDAVPGVEISCSWYGGSMHIVGLFILPGDPGLTRFLATMIESRDLRNLQVVEKLQALGTGITLEEVQGIAGGEVIGRPHFARALVQRGHCSSMTEAFANFLGGGKPAYVRRFQPMPDDAITVIHAAGGVAVWAHPMGKMHESKSKLRQTARTLQTFGLDAMEVRYSDFTPDDEKLAASVVAELGLLSSGGSDFHGLNIPDIALGTGRGALAVPDAFLPPLRAKANQHRLAAGLPTLT